MAPIWTGIYASIRYLGVHITSMLSWNVHCSKIADRHKFRIILSVLDTTPAFLY